MLIPLIPGYKVKVVVRWNADFAESLVFLVDAIEDSDLLVDGVLVFDCAGMLASELPRVAIILLNLLVEPKLDNGLITNVDIFFRHVRLVSSVGYDVAN